MNEDNESSAETQLYVRAFAESFVLAGKNEIEAAYENLRKLPLPTTEAGKILIRPIRWMESWLRICLRLIAGDDIEETTNLLKRWLKEVPDEEDTKQWRQTAKALLILITTKDPSKLTKKQLKQIEETDLSIIIYQAKATKKAYAKLDEAYNALVAEKTSEYLNKMAQGNEFIQQARKENPYIADLTSCAWLVTQLPILAKQQVEALEQFNFVKVNEIGVQLEKKIRELEEVHSGSNIKELISWGPQIGYAYQSLSKTFTELTELINDLFGRSANAKHMKILERLSKQLQELHDQATRIQGNKFIVNFPREFVLAASVKVLRIVKNLRAEVRPSRQAILSSSGMIAAISFILIVAVTLLINNLFEADFSPTIVLALGAFFGLVIGFGYGAIRFQGFFLGLFKGGVGRATGGDNE